MTQPSHDADRPLGILASIKAHKIDEVANLSRIGARSRLEQICRDLPPTRRFAERIASSYAAGDVALVAEIKKASPSKGVICPDFDVPRLARAYGHGGAACLSVVTDTRFFGGENDYVALAAAVSGLPVLRKDFLIDPIQALEARAIGADCVLLVLAMVDHVQARDLETAATELGLDVLIEVHDEAELDRALGMRSRLIGINNRDLRTFEADLGISMRLAGRVGRERLVVSESGIAGADDVARLLDCGIHAFLIGESLLKAADIETATRQICRNMGEIGREQAFAFG